MSDDEEDPFSDAIETSLFDEPEPAPDPAAAPELAAAPAAVTEVLSGIGPAGSENPPPDRRAEGAAEEPAVAGSSAVGSVVRTVVAAGAGAVWRGVRGSGSAEAHNGDAPEEGTISTSEVPGLLDGDGQPWTLVELKQSGAQAQLSVAPYTYSCSLIRMRLQPQ